MKTTIFCEFQPKANNLIITQYIPRDEEGRQYDVFIQNVNCTKYEKTSVAIALAFQQPGKKKLINNHQFETIQNTLFLAPHVNKHCKLIESLDIGVTELKNLLNKKEN